MYRRLFCAVIAVAMILTAGTVTVSADEEKGCIITGERSLGGLSFALDEFYNSFVTDNKEDVSSEETEDTSEELALFNSRLAVAKVTDFVNIRKAATIDSDIVGRLYRASIATYDKIEDGWVKISSKGVEGYVRSEYLLMDDEGAEYAESFYDNYVVVDSDTMNMRSGAGTDFGVISTLTRGMSLKVLDKQGDWYKVSTSGVITSKEAGYVHSDYVTSEYRYAIDSAGAEAIDSINATNINHMIWPLPSDHNIYTYFGPRKAPTAGASTYHQGLDIGGARGSSIVAVLSGTVVKAGWSNGGGQTVEIDHGNGVRTKYLHNSKLLVSEGQRVKQGDVIAKVGSTGIATGPHLHFSMSVNGNSVDPYPYLRKVH